MSKQAWIVLIGMALLFLLVVGGLWLTQRIYENQREREAVRGLIHDQASYQMTQEWLQGGD